MALLDNITTALSSDIFQSAVPNLLQTLGGIKRINQGADIAQTGSDLQAAAFRQQASTSIALANYNASLERKALSRKLQSIGRQTSRALGTQRVAAASTGFQVTSQSTLAIQAEALDFAARQVLFLRADTRQREEIIQFEGRSAAANAENQARAADFQGEVAQFNASNARRKAITSAFTQGASLLGGLF